MGVSNVKVVQLDMTITSVRPAMLLESARLASHSALHVRLVRLNRHCTWLCDSDGRPPAAVGGNSEMLKSEIWLAKGALGRALCNCTFNNDPTCAES